MLLWSSDLLWKVGFRRVAALLFLPILIVLPSLAHKVAKIKGSSTGPSAICNMV
jgi:hypothetical protein